MRPIFILIILFLNFGCSSLLYYPSKEQIYKPEQVGLKAEEVSIDSADGEKIHAWWFQAKGESKGTIVFFHGNAENLTSHFMQLSWMPDSGYSYLIFDYPGYGRSSGKPDPENCVVAGTSVIKWVNKNKDRRPLVIFGQSLGGNIAMKSTHLIKNEIPIHALAVDSTFDSFTGIAAHKLAGFWLTWIFQPVGYLVMSDEWAAKKIVSDLAPIPFLVIAGDSDPIIEKEFGENIFEKANQPKKLWIVPDGKHIDVFWGKDRSYRDKFVSWIENPK